ncbi:unnamed protein product [Cylicocyclus nassatus]|uniref:Uncharacterized protein n=1 Tax=Cylicocyclus nassatus TaxID=53992 RepID=A0AA36M5C7_CYLNA|nr:unnamed protein product [Cylicocyclus nassatus]
MEKLGFYIRKFIREAHNEARRRCPDISFKKGMLSIGREHTLTPTMAAYQFNINMETWRGLPLEEMMTNAEKTKVQNGEVTRGSLRLTGVNLTKPLRNVQSLPETSGSNENAVQKRPLHLEEGEENPNKIVKN